MSTSTALVRVYINGLLNGLGLDAYMFEDEPRDNEERKQRSIDKMNQSLCDGKRKDD